MEKAYHPRGCKWGEQQSLATLQGRGLWSPCTSPVSLFFFRPHRTIITLIYFSSLTLSSNSLMLELDNLIIFGHPYICYESCSVLLVLGLREVLTILKPKIQLEALKFKRPMYTNIQEPPNENIKRCSGTKTEFAKLSLELCVSCCGDQRD